MVSDQEICRCVESLLRQSAPGSVTSVDGVVHRLQTHLGLDLSHKAPFIRDHIQALLSPTKDHFALRPHLPQQYPSSYPPQAAPITAHLSHDLGLRFPAAAPPPIHHQQLPPVTVPAPAVARPVPAAPSPKESAPTGVKRRGGPGGLSKVCGVSPELQAIVGEPTMARTEIVKQLWAYIRKNNLQDPNNKRKIICNDELRLVFETDCTDMFKMNKLLAKHIITLEPRKTSGPNSKRLKTTATPEEVSANVTDAKEYAVAISDALAEFFGTGEREMLQSEALRRVWDYIKANNLEDPVNAVVITCDSKLQQLFGSEKLSALGMPELLAHHLFRQC